jgi:hypothetical protein
MPSLPQSKFRLSLDSWAVLFAIVLTILVRAGVLKVVSW